MSLSAAQTARAEAPAADDDAAIARQREQFKIGMTRYEAGQVREALETWLPIYAELGPERGYRLAYNLGVAYEQLGDATNAADRYQSFLAEVDARRGRGEDIEKIVTDEESDARSRLAGLQATRGRLRIDKGEGAIEVSIDATETRAPGYTAYVLPGSHRVRFANAGGTPDLHTVEVAAGQLVVVAPTPLPPEPPKPPVPTATGSAPPKPPPPVMIQTTEHPFSPVVLYVAGGLTLASVVVPVLTYIHAFNLRSTYDASTNPGERSNINADYDPARTVAYVTLAIPIALAVTTATLATVYFAGTKERSTPAPTVFAAPVQGGAAAGVRGSF